jgi:hypothetical protein
MRIQDIIRSMINMIDGAEQVPNQSTTTIIVAHPTATIAQPIDSSPISHGDDINRFRQIVDLSNNSQDTYGNAPNEKYADIDSVTVNAGGGVNGPKHPHDIRVKDPSAYPHTQDHSAELEPHSNGTGLHGALINAMRGL